MNAKSTQNRNPSDGKDITDPQKDQEKLAPEETEMDMPEIYDIPGQEHIRPVPLRGLSDITPSSDDEEGVGVVDKLNKPDDDELIITGNDTDISAEELSMLERMDGFEATVDNQNLTKAFLDALDDEGEELNEKGFGQELAGGDLDVSMAEQDDPLEAIGEEDEENNIYSPDSEDEDADSGQ